LEARSLLGFGHRYYGRCEDNVIEKKKEVRKPLTPEEQKSLSEAKAKARAEDRERANVLEKQLPRMTFRQLRGHLHRVVRNEKGQPGLTAAFGIVLGIVLENTQTKENPFAKLQAYPR
jgi:hypothetical protein